MYLEQKVDALTAQVAQLVALLQQGAPQVPAAPAANPAPQFAPQAGGMPAAFAPPAPTPAPVPQPQAAPQMPAPPSFAPPAPTPAAPTVAPFTDAKTLLEYATKKYATLGAEKGAQIQNVIASLGTDNINNIRPDQYAAFYAGVEALGQ